MSDDESVEMTELHWKIPDEEYNSFLEADGSLTHANRARLWNKYHSKALFCSSAEDGSLKNYTKGHAINRHRPKKRIYILYEMEDNVCKYRPLSDGGSYHNESINYSGHGLRKGDIFVIKEIANNQNDSLGYGAPLFMLKVSSTHDKVLCVQNGLCREVNMRIGNAHREYKKLMSVDN